MSRYHIAARLIEEDTPIIPEIVAESVVDEATRLAPDHAAALLSRRAELAAALAWRANAAYGSDPDSVWSKSIRGRGNRGRDTLHAFMRHWLAAELKRNDPRIFAALPSGYGT